LRIITKRNWLIISPVQTDVAQFILIEGPGKTVPFATGSISFRQIEKEHFSMNSNSNIALLDADLVSFPLILRKWKQGDYFYPLGMEKKKKLSRFFIDNKLSLVQKENTWVVEMNKKIIWVVGMRIDNRFRVTSNTHNILSLKLSVSQ
jgi:tRNA(Ile)-lysidine synthase